MKSRHLVFVEMYHLHGIRTAIVIYFCYIKLIIIIKRTKILLSWLIQSTFL